MSPKSKKKPKPVATRTRRSPYDMVQDLKTKLAVLDDVYAGKRLKLQERIDAMEAKHADRIALAELLVENTPEQIQADFEELRRREKLLRKALRKTKA